MSRTLDQIGPRKPGISSRKYGLLKSFGFSLFRLGWPVALAALTLGISECQSGGDDDDTPDSSPAPDQETSKVHGVIEETYSSDAYTSNQSAQRLAGVSSESEIAVSVTLSAVNDDGSLSLLAEGGVDAAGYYELEAPAGYEDLVVETTNESGVLVGAALLESTGEDGDDIAASPITVETSFEVEIYLKMKEMEAEEAGEEAPPEPTPGEGGGDATPVPTPGEGGGDATPVPTPEEGGEEATPEPTPTDVPADDEVETNPIDVRIWISAEVAASIQTLREEGDDAEEEIEALALSIMAAQETEITAYQEMGISTSQSGLFEMELSAALSMSASLDGGASEEETMGQFYLDLEAAYAGQNIDSEEASEATSEASLAFRLTLEHSLEDAAGATESLVDAAKRNAAEVEAYWTAAAVEAIFFAADASAEIQAAATASGEALIEAVQDAESEAEAASAYQAFSAELVGEGSVEGSLLGEYFKVNAVTALTTNATVSLVVTAGDVLETTVANAADVLFDVSAQVDTQALAEAIVEAWYNYRQAVDLAILADPILARDPETASSILIEATGSFTATKGE